MANMLSCVRRHSSISLCVGKQLHTHWPASVVQKSWKQQGHMYVSRCDPQGIQTLHLVHAICLFFEVKKQDDPLPVHEGDVMPCLAALAAASIL